jgi:hypothetical protein
MLWQIKVDLEFGVFFQEDCTKIMEIDSESTLEDLHLAIQEAVEFDNDHMYSFFIARNAIRSKKQASYDMMDGNCQDVTLEEIFPLDKGMGFFYWFDFGDDWIFRVKKMRKKVIEEDGVEYPRVIKTIGNNPVQYPDEDFWDDEDEDEAF